jgi:hypothetical protein
VATIGRVQGAEVADQRNSVLGDLIARVPLAMVRTSSNADSATGNTLPATTQEDLVTGT